MKHGQCRAVCDGHCWFERAVLWVFFFGDFFLFLFLFHLLFFSVHRVAVPVYRFPFLIFWQQPCFLLLLLLVLVVNRDPQLVVSLASLNAARVNQSQRIVNLLLLLLLEQTETETDRERATTETETQCRRLRVQLLTVARCL